MFGMVSQLLLHFSLENIEKCPNCSGILQNRPIPVDWCYILVVPHYSENTKNLPTSPYDKYIMYNIAVFCSHYRSARKFLVGKCA